MLPELHRRALRHVAGCLASTDILWVVTGSAGFALQGVPVEVHDLDIQTDAAGAYAIAQRFAKHIVQPVSFAVADRIRSHFGVLEIEGLRVELMGDIAKRRPDGSWDDPVPLARYRRFVAFDELRIPVLDLAYEAQAYRQLGRLDRAALLEAFLRER